MSARVPVYPWPFHPEVYRRDLQLDDQKRHLDKLGIASFPRGSGSASMGLMEAIEPAPQEVDFSLIGALPVVGKQWTNTAPEIDAQTGHSNIPMTMLESYVTAPSPMSWHERNDNTVKIVNTGAISILRIGAPYWFYPAVVIPLEEKPDNEFPTLSATLAEYPAFTVPILPPGPTQRTFEGNHFRLQRDGSAVWEGSASYQLDVFKPDMTDVYFILSWHYADPWYGPQIDAYIATNPFFEGKTMRLWGDLLPDKPNPSVYAEGLERFTGSTVRDVVGKWIDADEVFLIGETEYAHHAPGQPSQRFEGKLLQHQSNVVLLTDGRLYRHDYAPTNGTRTLLDTDVYFVSGGRYWTKTGEEKIL